MGQAFSIAIRSGIQAIRDVILPGVILLVVAAILAYLYYFQPEVHYIFNIYGAWRIEYGVIVSMGFLAFCSGLLPWTFRMLLPGMKPQHPRSELIFLTLYWGAIGWCNDTVYSFQGDMFGEGNNVSIVIYKVLFDQFVYSLIFAAPLNGTAYYWKDTNYSMRLLKASFNRQWYPKIVLPMYIMGLTIWIPGTSIIYSMPAELQIFMASIISCFFSLICSYVAAHARENNSKPVKL